MDNVKPVLKYKSDISSDCFKDLVLNKDIDGLCEIINSIEFGLLSSYCKKPREYQYLGAAYLKSGLYEQCLRLLNAGCQRHPGSLALMNLKAICYSRRGDFDSEIFLLENIIRLQCQNALSADEKYKTRLERARKKIFNKENRETIYFNQDNCLRYIRSESLADILFITFWGSRGEDRDKFGDDFFYLRQGYAEKFILQNGWDVLAVNKRRYDFYQDLSLFEFDKLVRPIVKKYKKVFMYGGSGGGYAALYYAVNISAEPIVYSPRIRLDSVCGLSVTESSPALNHNALSDFRSDNKVHVFYDPFFKPDINYVKERVLPCFPNARCYESPFSGHGAFYLAEIGAVKDIVLSIVEGKVCEINNSKRKVSKIYHFYLANYLFLKGKISSGVVVSIRGLRIDSDKKTKVDKVNIYNQLVKYLRRSGRHEIEDNVNLEFRGFQWFSSSKNKYRKI